MPSPAFESAEHSPMNAVSEFQRFTRICAFTGVSIWFGLSIALPQVGSTQTSRGDFPDFDELMKKSPVAGSNATPSTPSGVLPGSTSSVRPPSTSNNALPLSGQEGRTRTSSPLPAEQDSLLPEQMRQLKSFDWTKQTISIADLRLSEITTGDATKASVMEHGHAFLTVAEESVYLDMLDAIARQRRALLQRTVEDLKSTTVRTAEWEKAFYQFENVRRLAWDNGQLRSRPGADRIGGLPNPFSEPVEVTKDGDETFRLLSDIDRFPEHYTGRPVIMYGMFRATKVIRLGMDQPKRATAGALPGDDGRRPEVRLLQGSLSTLNGNMHVATIDTKGILTPNNGLQSIDDHPANVAIPVLIKGWVVKKWDQGPLIFCEALRQISPMPHYNLVRQNTVDRQHLREEETWLYYETLRQLELTSPRLQKDFAATSLQHRIGSLMKEIDDRTKSELATATAELQAGSISESVFRERKTGLLRRLSHRIGRYRQLQKDPQNFQTYVDMFQFPEVYHGKLVTLHGHVRHVVSYPGDDTLSDGRMLHELWLFTDDSQHNPAVIVTPNLPTDFPTEAETIDRVSVTGCFFKRYVYGSQDTDRIAPLILAGKIGWQPTADQVHALVKDGHLAANSKRATAAAAITQGLSRTATLMIGFFIVLTLMVLWGRAQREERDRVRLRKHVNQLPEFENPVAPGYALPLNEYETEFSEYTL